MLATRMLLWSAARTALRGLVTLWGMYLIFYVAAACLPSPGGDNPYNIVGFVARSLKVHLAHFADIVGHIAALGATPTPLIAGTAVGGWLGLSLSLRAADNFIEQSRPNAIADTVDHTGPPVTHEAVVTAAPANLGFAALDNAATLVRASSTLGLSLADVITREERCARRLLQDRLGRLTTDRDASVMVTGPVQAILLDPMLPRLTGDQRGARIRQILHETRPASLVRELTSLLLPLIGIGGCVALLMADVVPLLIALPGAVACAAVMMIPRRRGAYVPGPGEIVLPPRYPTITIDDALQLAGLTPQLWHTSTMPSGPNSEPDDVSAPAAHTDRRRRIAEVHAAIAELDAEWLDYQLDLHAWFLAKPQLRNLNDPIIWEYRHAEADLRDQADELTDAATDSQITDAQDAARRALKAWGTANRHALDLGVTDLSPSEEAALNTLHGLVSQLNDRATPKAMWPQLINAITRTMTKLATVPCTLADIAALPVVASESRLRALEQHSAR